MMQRSQSVAPPTTVVRGVGPGARPLSHHEILTLMGPFRRRGRHADLPACRRTERRLAFAPVLHPSPAPGLPPLRDVLSLEARETGWFRLVRVLSATGRGSGAMLSASLTAAGRDLDALLAQVDAVPPARHFPVSSGVCLERSYRLAPPPEGEAAPPNPVTVLTGARAVVQGVTLEVDADRGGGMPAQVRLTPPPGRRLEIPQDLLAVLGREWRPMQDRETHWLGSIRAAPDEPKRTADLEAKLERTVAHLEETLGGTPTEFHRRHHEARWRALRRRAAPAFASCGVIFGIPAIALSPAVEGPRDQMLLLQIAGLLLLGIFAFTDLPRVEIPSLPRDLPQERWLVDDR